MISSGNNPYSTIFQTATQSANVTYTLPAADGNTNYVLTTNGSGQLFLAIFIRYRCWYHHRCWEYHNRSAFTGSDLGNELVFNGSDLSLQPHHITVTADEPTSDLTYTLPDIGTNGTFAFLEGNRHSPAIIFFTGTSDFQNNSGITVGKDNYPGTNNVPGQISLISSGNNPYSTIFQTATQSANVTYTLPAADGNTNYVLTTNGSGQLSLAIFIRYRCWYHHRCWEYHNRCSIHWF